MSPTKEELADRISAWFEWFCRKGTAQRDAARLVARHGDTVATIIWDATITPKRTVGMNVHVNANLSTQVVYDADSPFDAEALRVLEDAAVATAEAAIARAMRNGFGAAKIEVAS